ncbi:hypothetical protein DY000_02010983 [Brassica cretica]|uniref:Glycoside hydrolase family 5 domain-containing protein n=1 Tax=Brassica cretica TaxID=69181 RepID=A0ABQ7CTD3_BRACR|nr:hypothetical protein DY000_02010983 [Brassica cretica]
MVVLDNHNSKPGWCCTDNDQNGFFGDKHFNPQLWIKGLTKMASMFSNVSSNVIGMSLRNELRGPKQNVKDWYKYMRQGAEAVHSVNPNVLVIVSGLNFDADLSFLKDRPFEVSFRRKLVFEIHWYGFWRKGHNWNKICGKETKKLMNESGFLLEEGFPLFLSEFGIDQRGNNVNDNRFLSCFLALAMDLDLDWVIWTLAGSYYIRQKTIEYDESYGILDWTRSNGNSTKENNVPSCDWTLHREELIVSTEAWFLQRTRKVYEEGKSVKLRLFSSESNCSKWKVLSESKMQLSLVTKDGESVCLDVDSGSGNIVTKSCKCLEGNGSCDPTSQWFKLVISTRSRVKPEPVLQISPYSKTFLQKPLSVL